MEESWCSKCHILLNCREVIVWCCTLTHQTCPTHQLHPFSWVQLKDRKTPLYTSLTSFKKICKLKQNHHFLSKDKLLRQSQNHVNTAQASHILSRSILETKPHSHWRASSRVTNTSSSLQQNNGGLQRFGNHFRKTTAGSGKKKPPQAFMQSLHSRTKSQASTNTENKNGTYFCSSTWKKKNTSKQNW